MRVPLGSLISPKYGSESPRVQNCVPLQNTVQRSHTELMRLKKSLAEVHDDREAWKQKAEALEAAKTQLFAEVQKASSVKDNSLSRMEALREEFEQTRDQEIARERAELQAQHQEEVDRLKESLAELDGLRNSVGTLEERNKELSSQVEKCSSLEQQVAALGQQLEAEQAAKKVKGCECTCMLSPHN